MKKNSDLVMVYSTDPKDQEKLKGKSKTIESTVDLKKLVINFRLEKNGRGGKTVTVLGDLPPNKSFLELLLKELKAQCGAGGTLRMEGSKNWIEIQGDKVSQIKKILETKGIKHKGF